MKAIITILVTILVMVTAQSDRAAAQSQTVPSSAGGFTLNKTIEEYGIQGNGHYLGEVIVSATNGFRKGFITYGTCDKPGGIVRIKLKYEDRSYALFEKLLERYKVQFGKKPKFSGDRFGNVKSWKWAFTNSDGQRVNLVLQHNLKDTDESIGNMVKLSLPDQINSERECFNKTLDEESSQSSTSATGTDIDWEALLPH